MVMIRRRQQQRQYNVNNSVSSPLAKTETCSNLTFHQRSMKKFHDNNNRDQRNVSNSSSSSSSSDDDENNRHSFCNCYDDLPLDSDISTTATAIATATATSTTTKKSTIAAYYHPKNQSLQHWFDDLLNEFDNIVPIDLNINPNHQDNDRGVKDLIKKIKHLNKNSDNNNNEEVRDTTSNDNAIFETTSKNAKLDEMTNISLKKNLETRKNPISCVSNFIKNAVEKNVPIFEKSRSPENNKKVENPARKRIELARRKNGNHHSINIGSIEKRGKNERILNNRYIINKKDKIGEGHNGKVIKGIDTETNTLVAIKCLKKQFRYCVGTIQYANKKQKKKNSEIIHEGRMMIRMEGLQNLIPLLDLVETPKKIYYIMPLASKDLSDVVYRKRLTENCARRLLKPIFEAVKTMHDSGYVHRDIKPENVMLYEDGTAKLGDFGLSTEFGYHSGLQVVGTPAFAAPEVLGQFHRTDKLAWLNYKRADSWSLGATLYVCLAGKYPFDDQKPAIEQLNAGVKFPEKCFKHCSPETIDLIEKLMISDPLKRISVEEALDHPFFGK